MNDDETLGDALGPDQGEMRERRRAARSGRRRGRSSTPMLSVISWRDIPAQLTTRGGDDAHKLLLHARFQHAIDRAAAVAGLTSTDSYVADSKPSSRTVASNPHRATDDPPIGDAATLMHTATTMATTTTRPSKNWTEPS